MPGKAREHSGTLQSKTDATDLMIQLEIVSFEYDLVLLLLRQVITSMRTGTYEVQTIALPIGFSSSFLVSTRLAPKPRSQSLHGMQLKLACVFPSREP